MRLDSSFESLAGLASGRSGSVADLADETPRSRAVHRHSYAAPAHNDPDMPTPTKPFGLGKLFKNTTFKYLITPCCNLKYIFYSTRYTLLFPIHSFSLPPIHCHAYNKLIYQLNELFADCTRAYK